MIEYKTLNFENTEKGQKEKIHKLGLESKNGWEVVSEIIEQGSFKAGNAVCLGLICLPLAFFAGREDGAITVTLQRHRLRKCPFCDEEVKPSAVICRFCGRDLPKIEKADDSEINEACESLSEYGRIAQDEFKALMTINDKSKIPEIKRNIIEKINSGELIVSYDGFHHGFHNGFHHWGNDDKTHNIVRKCYKCGDIYHGAEFEECTKCGAFLRLISS